MDYHKTYNEAVHLTELEFEGEQGLINNDLKPVPASMRKWGTWNYAALWISMSLCIPTYMLASSLIGGGMNWWQAIFTIFLGNTIVLIPMILNGHAGAKYGIPFPVFARASFGIKGANVPALLRAIVACGWFGIQTWIGGTALYCSRPFFYQWRPWHFYFGLSVQPMVWGLFYQRHQNLQTRLLFLHIFFQPLRAWSVTGLPFH